MLKDVLILAFILLLPTARPPRAANQFVQNFPFVDYFVYYNGALVTCKSKQTQLHISIPNEICQQINQFIELQAPQWRGLNSIHAKISIKGRSCAMGT
ncbi:HAD family hydrolase [Paenibacillus sp. 2RAB27]|uniref:HAD family hydrolase n=1 Tax=Paenibacillus sp. 2RAB27 TaxID=3232991 RepID=UPI003F9B5745